MFMHQLLDEEDDEFAKPMGDVERHAETNGNTVNVAM